jgi:hypothetical protein
LIIPGPCVRCTIPTDTVLGLADPWQWRTSALMVLIGDHIVPDLHQYASKLARFGGDAVDVCQTGIKVRICQSCVRHAGRDHFPDPVVAMVGAEIPFVKPLEVRLIGDWPIA